MTTSEAAIRPLRGFFLAPLEPGARWKALAPGYSRSRLRRSGRHHAERRNRRDCISPSFGQLTTGFGASSGRGRSRGPASAPVPSTTGFRLRAIFSSREQRPEGPTGNSRGRARFLREPPVRDGIERAPEGGE